MSASKISKKPIAEQIAYYEEQIHNIDANIKKAIAQKRAMESIIRRLQRPDAETKYQKRMAQSRHHYEMKQRKEAEFARNRARIEREVEECLRMNGKII